MPTKPARAPRKPPKKRELTEWIGQARPERIGESDWEKLLGLLAPISEGYLRRLLRESGVALAPLVEGVRQESFDALEASLLDLLAEYESGDAGRRMRVRKIVIEGKDHARLAARQEGKRAEKDEMALWMLTWLENPSVFPEWVRLRRVVMAKE